MEEPGFGKGGAPKERGGLLRLEGVKLRIWPIVLTILLGFGIPWIPDFVVPAVQHFVRLPDLPIYPWMEFSYECAVVFLLALIAIGVMKGMVRADYGVHRPREDSYIAPAIMLGFLLGGLMTLSNYWSEITTHHAPSGHFELTPVNIAGWMAYQAVLVPLADETLYRGLLVTYLSTKIPGQVSFLRLRVNAGGVLVALIFAAPYLGGFVAYSPLVALFRLFVVFLQGIAFAYWFEKSKSLWAPIVGHGVCFATYQVLIFVMAAVWYPA